MKIIGYLLLIVLAVAGCDAKTIGSTRAQKLSFRIVGATEKIQKSGFSVNRDVLVARAVDKKGHADWVKIEYRYLGYEHEFPNELLSSEILHTFVAVRDYSCDETLHSLRTKYVTDVNGRLAPVDTLRYTGNDVTLDISGEQPLPCFVVRPKTYRGSTQAKRPALPTQATQGE